MGFFPPWRLLLMYKSKNGVSFSVSWVYRTVVSLSSSHFPHLFHFSLSLSLSFSGVYCTVLRSLSYSVFFFGVHPAVITAFLFLLFRENVRLFSSLHCICHAKVYFWLPYILFLYHINLCLSCVSHIISTFNNTAIKDTECYIYIHNTYFLV